MKIDLELKITNILSKGSDITEAEVAYLLILVRRKFEQMSDPDKKMHYGRENYPFLNLFCDWSVHDKIDRSTPGFETLAKINDALVSVMDRGDYIVGEKLSEAIGYDMFRNQLILFLKEIKLDVSCVESNDIWKIILIHFLEITRNGSLEFGGTGIQSKKKQEIYEMTVRKAKDPGMNVVEVQIVKVKYSEVNSSINPENCGECFAVQIKIERGQYIQTELQY